MDDEIDLLKQKEKNISKACCKTENNLDTTMKTFSEKIDAFGTNINKLHHHVTKSMKNVRIYFLRIPSYCWHLFFLLLSKTCEKIVYFLGWRMFDNFSFKKLDWFDLFVAWANF